MISMVSASMLTEKIKNMKISDIKNIKSEDVLSMLKIKLNLARVKCALLGFEAVKGALE